MDRRQDEGTMAARLRGARPFVARQGRNIMPRRVRAAGKRAPRIAAAFAHPRIAPDRSAWTANAVVSRASGSARLLRRTAAPVPVRNRRPRHAGAAVLRRSTGQTLRRS
jgi:hypothetical protein